MSELIFSMTLDELCESEGIATELVIEMVEYGIVKPLQADHHKQWQFDSTSVHWLKKSLRLQRDFEIDWIAVAMVIDLMQKNEALQKENAAFQRHIERFIEG